MESTLPVGELGSWEPTDRPFAECRAARLPAEFNDPLGSSTPPLDQAATEEYVPR